MTSLPAPSSATLAHGALPQATGSSTRATPPGSHGHDAHVAVPFSAALDHHAPGSHVSQRPGQSVGTLRPGGQAIGEDDADAVRGDAHDDTGVLADQTADLARQVWAWVTPALPPETTSHPQARVTWAADPQAADLQPARLGGDVPAEHDGIRPSMSLHAARVSDADGFGDPAQASGTSGRAAQHEAGPAAQSRSARSTRLTDIGLHHVPVQGADPSARAASDDGSLALAAAPGGRAHTPDLESQATSTVLDRFTLAGGGAAAHSEAAHLEAALPLQPPRASDGVSRAAQVHAPVGHPSWTQDVVSHVVNWTRSGSDGLMKAELFLTPSELGPLRVAITLADGVASAAFVSAHAPVRQALEQALPHLQAALAQSGIALGQTHVGDPGREAGFHGQDPREGQTGHGAHATDGTRTGAPAHTVVVPATGSARPGNHLLDVFA